jgi:hypothetical protein
MATAAPATRAQRNRSALASARATQRARPASTARPASAPARRKSGAAKPRTAAAAPAPSAVARVLNSRGMPLLDRILRGPGWVVMLGALLAGIVFLNVSVLELNRGIARTDAKSAELERINSGLRARVAKLDSGERIQELAAARGFVMPQPSQVTYVRERPTNVRLVAQRLASPAPSPSTSTSMSTPTAATATTPTTTSAATPSPTTVPTAQATATVP